MLAQLSRSDIDRSDSPTWYQPLVYGRSDAHTGVNIFIYQRIKIQLMHISTLSKAIICVLQGDFNTLLTGTKIRFQRQLNMSAMKSRPVGYARRTTCGHFASLSLSMRRFKGPMSVNSQLIPSVKFVR